MAQGVAWNARAPRRPVHRRRARPRAARRSSRRSSASAARIVKVPVRALVAGARRAPLPRHRGPLRPPGVAIPPSSPATARSASRSWRTCPTSTPCSCPTAAAGSRAASPSALRALAPAARVFACEVETAAPLAASLARRARRVAIDYTPSFVDGIGARGAARRDVAARELLAGSVVSTSRRSRRPSPGSRRAEGAGAALVAAAAQTRRAGRSSASSRAEHRRGRCDDLRASLSRRSPARNRNPRHQPPATGGRLIPRCGRAGAGIGQRLGDRRALPAPSMRKLKRRSISSTSGSSSRRPPKRVRQPRRSDVEPTPIGTSRRLAAGRSGEVPSTIHSKRRPAGAPRVREQRARRRRVDAEVKPKPSAKPIRRPAASAPPGGRATRDTPGARRTSLGAPCASLLELLQRLRPVAAQQLRERAVGEELAARLAGRAVVRLVLRVDDPLDRRPADGTRLAVAAVHGHPLAERGHLLRESRAAASAPSRSVHSDSTARVAAWSARSPPREIRCVSLPGESRARCRISSE